MKLFLDTNVVVDLCAGRQPYYADASKIMELAARHEVSLVVSSLTFVNVAYVLRKVVGIDEIYTRLGSLLKYVYLSPIDESVVKSAISANRKDFEDAVQYYSASSCDADLIITRDKSGFLGFPIEACSPSEFIGRCS